MQKLKVRRFYIESRNGSYQVVEQVGEKYNVIDKGLTLNQANKLYSSKVKGNSSK